MIKLKEEEEYQKFASEVNNHYNNRKCYKCGSNTRKLKEKNRIVCSFPACKCRFTCYKGTIFENSPLPIITLIKVIDMWIENVPCDLIVSIAGIHRSSVFEICNKLRSLGGLDLYLNKFDRIGGNNAIVEIDESKFGRRKYNRGHRVEGVWFVGAVERINKRIVLRHVEKRGGYTLTTFCKKYIKKETTIYSDCWKGYSNLSKEFFKHQTVNYSKHFVNRQTNTHTNTIEGNWSGIKRTIPIRSRTWKLIDIYLLRFMLKRNEGSNSLEVLLKLFY